MLAITLEALLVGCWPLRGWYGRSSGPCVQVMLGKHLRIPMVLGPLTPKQYLKLQVRPWTPAADLLMLVHGSSSG